MESRGSIPLIGPWLERRSVRELCRRAAAGDEPAVQDLAAVFCTDTDPKARHLAGRALRSIPAQSQADILCDEVLLRNHPALLALAQETGHLPSDPARRALYLFCTSAPVPQQGKKDYDLLSAGYAGAPAPMRARARAASRAGGTCGTLARALVGAEITRNAGQWNGDEWDIVIQGLFSEGSQEDLWLLAPLAPLPLAITVINALKEAGWAPAGDDRILWDAILPTLPGRWTFPVPALRDLPAAVNPSGRVARLSFFPDGSRYVSVTSDGLVTVRRTASPGSAAEFRAGPVRTLAISADNSLVIIAGEDGQVSGRGIGERACAWSCACGEGATALAISSAGTSVLAGDSRGTLFLLGAGDGQVLATTAACPAPVTCLAHDDAGSASGHADGTVVIHRFSGPGGITMIPKTGSPVRSLTFTPAGKNLIVLYERGNPALFDTLSGIRIRTFTGFTGRLSCWAVPADGAWFAAGSDAHRLWCWDRKDSSPVSVLPLYNRTATSCATVPDGNLLALGFQDGTIRICRMPGATLIREFRGHKKAVTACTLAPDGTRLATVSWDGTARIWRVPEGEILRTLDARAGGIAALAGPADGCIAIASEDGLARIIDASDGTLVRSTDLYTPVVRAFAMSPGGTYIASAGADSSVRIWTARDGGLAGTAAPLSTSQRCCAFFPDGGSLLTGGWDGVSRIFRVPDATLLRTLHGHTSTVTCCTVSRDGSLLVTGSNDHTVRLWDIRRDGAYAVLRDFRTEVGAVTLSPDETLLAAGSSDGRILVYRLPYGAVAGELAVPPGRVTTLAFTPDGSILAAGFENGTCSLFSLQPPARIRTLHAHAGAVTGILFHPDGRALVTTGSDGICRFHPAPAAPVLCNAGLSDIPAAAAEESEAVGSEKEQWAFLRAMLAIRFRGEIGICPLPGMAGMFDIQIAGYP